MAYTPSPVKTKTTIGNIGPQRRDSNNVPLQGSPGNYIQTIDATATPLTSPLTVNTTATLVVPQGAAQVTIASVTNAVQVSEDSTQSTYFSLPANMPWTFDCANQQYVYLKTSLSTVVSFVFSVF